MTKGIARYESGSRGSGGIRIPISARALLEFGKANSRERGACLAASILATTRVFASGVTVVVITTVTLAAIAAEVGAGTSITGGDETKPRREMKHRHIHAKKGEWIHVHRDNNPGYLGIVAVIIIIALLIHGC